MRDGYRKEKEGKIKKEVQKSLFRLQFEHSRPTTIVLAGKFSEDTTLGRAHKGGGAKVYSNVVYKFLKDL